MAIMFIILVIVVMIICWVGLSTERISCATRCSHYVVHLHRPSAARKQEAMVISCIETKGNGYQLYRNKEHWLS